MWENLRNDPFFKVVLVAVVGILAFGLLFNLFSGQGGLMGFGGYQNGGMAQGGEHMGNSGVYGFSFASLIGGLLALLIKLLIFILIIAVVIGIFTWTRNYMAKNNNAPWVQTINSDPLLRTVSLITIAILGLVLVSGIFSSFTGYGMGGGYNLMYGIAGLLAVVIKLLSYILVISLIVAAAIYIKKQYESGNVNLFATDKTVNVNTNPLNTNNVATTNVSPINTDKTGNEFKTKNDRPL